MVDPITGHKSVVVPATAATRSRPVAGEALNQRVLPRRDERSRDDKASDQEHKPPRDAEPDVKPGAEGTRPPAPRGATAVYRRDGHYAGGANSEDVLISRSTAVLLAEDLSSLIRRGVNNVGLVAHSLMRIPDTAAHDLERRFHIAALTSVRQAREIYVRQNGNPERMPQGLAFERISARYNELSGVAEISIARAAFIDRVDLNARGVVFDVRGHGAVSEPRPGIFVDTGEHGALIANTIIETVRRDLPNFGSSEDTGGAIVVIRADESDFTNHRAYAEALSFDLILPYSRK